MPLFELYRRAQEKLNSRQDKGQSCSADLSIPEDEFVELIWENGQVVMQGQSSRPKKSQSSFGLLSEFTAQSPWISDKGVGNGAASNSRKFEAELGSGLSEFPMSSPPSEMCLTHDEDIVPWFSCPINEPLRNDYSSDFLPELSGVPVNELSNLYSFDSTQKSNDKEVTPAPMNGAKVPSAADVKINGLGMNTALPSIQQGVMDTFGSSKCSITYDSTFGDLSRLPRLAVGSTSEKGQAKDDTPSAKNSNFINFSHFARVAAPSHANIENNARAGGSGSSILERAVCKEKCSSANDSITVDNLASNLSGCPRTEASSNCQVQREQLMVASKPLICQEDALKNDKSADQSCCASSSKGSPDNEKMTELGAATSSVCSGNSAERASDAPQCSLKRKCPCTNNSEALAEDVDADSVGVKKAAAAAAARSTSSKRSRAAEVHNLSERVDKASMLDEAIEYLKTLQLQVQMMSMANGLYVPPMMFPTGIQQIHPSQMAQFAPMGLGMGMVGVNCGTHVPMPHVSASTALHSTAAPNFPLMGLPCQGLPMSMPCLSSLVPFPGVAFLKPGTGPNTSAFVGPGTMENTDAAIPSSLKESMQNVNNASCVTNHTSTQFQARNGDLQKSTSVQDTCPDSDINEGGVADSANQNSTRLVREDCGS
ncbi:hypothetical protein BT93_B1202 [Corymbia citriodora subsp. variegata]|nr:hypothetical protein BT93_B1202 [Corymbia citriodora subsp. variegata]